ncbi:hypothetical protein HYT25_02570 [Candidatus Pacearchaeota archaeon]|nr:hypothetical protein [Candidatus Pacearchaeota archaeon]
MTIKKSLSKNMGNICTLERISVKEDGVKRRGELKGDGSYLSRIFWGNYRLVGGYPVGIKTHELSAEDILNRASDNGEYVIQPEEKKVLGREYENEGPAKGKIEQVVFSDSYRWMPDLCLTFDEFVKQGRPLRFKRTLIYKPIKEGGRK